MENELTLNNLELPNDFHKYFIENYGTPLSTKQIDHVDSSIIIKISTSLKPLILKKSKSKREASFYKSISEHFSESGLPIPVVEWIDNINHEWILMEYFPHTLPENRWVGDLQVINYLSKIHSLPTTILEDSIEVFRPVWDQEMNEKALSCLSNKNQEEISNLLLELMETSQNIFYPQSVIAGDPKPKHWGIRKNESLVLFEWSSIGIGSPALDLATSICTSEDIVTSTKVAESYISQNQIYELSEKAILNLSNDILKGCAWNYINFLAQYVDQQISTSDSLISFIIDYFPKWLKRTPIRLY